MLSSVDCITTTSESKFLVHTGLRARPRLRVCAYSARNARRRPLSSSFSPQLVCDALDRASPDAERLGHLQDTHALRKLLSHLAFGRAVYLRPAELHALGDGALEACFDSLANHGPLKFSKGASDLENELAHRRGRGSRFRRAPHRGDQFFCPLGLRCLASERSIKPRALCTSARSCRTVCSVDMGRPRACAAPVEAHHFSIVPRGYYSVKFRCQRCELGAVFRLCTQPAECPLSPSKLEGDRT
jgi:hypothetical protein